MGRREMERGHDSLGARAGFEIARLAEDRDMTLRQLAGEAGWSETWLNQLCRGTIPNPGAQGLADLCRVLDVEIGPFFDHVSRKAEARESVKAITGKTFCSVTVLFETDCPVHPKDRYATNKRFVRWLATLEGLEIEGEGYEGLLVSKILNYKMEHAPAREKVVVTAMTKKDPRRSL